MSRYNPYQVICKGESCKLYDKCDDKCILKENSKRFLKGCNYSNENDCKYCSHKNKCILIKPYSDKIGKIESKRNYLECENRKLHEYISKWDTIENDLEKYNVNSVTDVIYFKRNKQQMIDRINDNEKLIKAYRKKEKELCDMF